MSQLRPPISLSTHRPVSSPFSWSYIVSHTPLLPLFHPPETHTHTHRVPSLPLLSASVKQQSLLRPGGLTCVYPWSERWFGGSGRKQWGLINAQLLLCLVFQSSVGAGDSGCERDDTNHAEHSAVPGNITSWGTPHPMNRRSRDTCESLVSCKTELGSVSIMPYGSGLYEPIHSIVLY